MTAVRVDTPGPVALRVVEQGPAAGLSPPAPGAAAASRSGRVLMPLVLAAIGIVLLAAGWLLPWLAPALGHGRRASSIPVGLAPIGVWAPAVSYGLVVTVALLPAVAGLATVRARRVLLALAAALSLTAAVAFVVLALTTDVRLQFQLQAADADYSLVVGKLPYAVPHPHIANILVFPLSDPAARLVSALRAGWLATLAGGVVLAVASRRCGPAPAPVDAPGRLRGAAVPSMVLLVVLLPGASMLRGLWAQQQADQADRTAAVGRYGEAAARYARALSVNPALAWDKSAMVRYGGALLALGRAGRPEALLAQSRLDVLRGADDRARSDLAQALAQRPGDQVLRDELRRQAIAAAQLRSSPSLALAAQQGRFGTDTALSWTVAKLTFAAQDYDLAALRFRDVLAASPDTDVRSACFTYIAVAQLRTGRADDARRSLASALAADPGHVNVAARSLAAGLYSAVTL